MPKKNKIINNSVPSTTVIPTPEPVMPVQSKKKIKINSKTIPPVQPDIPKEEPIPVNTKKTIKIKSVNVQKDTDSISQISNTSISLPEPQPISLPTESKKKYSKKKDKEQPLPPVVDVPIPEPKEEIKLVIEENGKRGRKPKPTKDEVSEPSSPKKRGRKPKEKVVNILPAPNEIENENIIIHLPIKPNMIKNSETEMFKYNPDVYEPTGYEEYAGSTIDQYQFLSQKNNPNKDSELIGEGPKPNSSFCQFPFDEKEKDIFELLENVDESPDEHEDTISNVSNSNISNNINNETSVVHKNNWYKNNTTTDNKQLSTVMEYIKKQREMDIENMANKQHKNTVEKCLIQFDEANKTNSWPSSTSVYCWWCSHPFNTTPCSLPIEYKNNTFTVFGVFCSPECATAYNFDDTNSGCDLWERYSLLNFLYRKIYNDKSLKIKSAPPRQTLKIFGGNLSIKEFRYHNSNYEMNYKIVMPPMTSIIPVQEISTLDKGYTSKNEKKLILIEKDKLSMDGQPTQLRLRRDKPVNNINTLDKCMLTQQRDDISTISEN